MTAVVVSGNESGNPYHCPAGTGLTAGRFTNEIGGSCHPATEQLSDAGLEQRKKALQDALNGEGLSADRQEKLNEEMALVRAEEARRAGSAEGDFDIDPLAPSLADPFDPNIHTDIPKLADWAPDGLPMIDPGHGLPEVPDLSGLARWADGRLRMNGLLEETEVTAEDLVKMREALAAHLANPQGEWLQATILAKRAIMAANGGDIPEDLTSGPTAEHPDRKHFTDMDDFGEVALRELDRYLEELGKGEPLLYRGRNKGHNPEQIAVWKEQGNRPMVWADLLPRSMDSEEFGYYSDWEQAGVFPPGSALRGNGRSARQLVRYWEAVEQLQMPESELLNPDKHYFNSAQSLAGVLSQLPAKLGGGGYTRTAGLSRDTAWGKAWFDELTKMARRAWPITPTPIPDFEIIPDQIDIRPTPDPKFWENTPRGFSPTQEVIRGPDIGPDAESFNKHRIVADLAAATGVEYETVDSVIAGWASMDHRFYSIQATADKILGGNGTHDSGYGKFAYDRDSLEELGLDSFSYKQVRHPEETEKILRAMYSQTQGFLEGAGVDTLQLHRGAGWSINSDGDNRRIPHQIRDIVLNASDEELAANRITVTGEWDRNPMTSWSSDYDMADQFAATGSNTFAVIQSVDAPREAVIGSCRTGVGCLRESEFVLLDTGGDAHFEVFLRPPGTGSREEPRSMTRAEWEAVFDRIEFETGRDFDSEMEAA